MVTESRPASEKETTMNRIELQCDKVEDDHGRVRSYYRIYIGPNSGNMRQARFWTAVPDSMVDEVERRVLAFLQGALNMKYGYPGEGDACANKMLAQAKGVSYAVDPEF